MYGTGIASSLILIATGAILAFAVTYQTPAVDINAVGVILLVVGIFGLVLSFLLYGDFFSAPTRSRYSPEPGVRSRDDMTRPHTHRHVDSSDVVYEDEEGPRVERVERTRR
jgi:hypothetical protein